MKIAIVQRLQPFVHTPGRFCVVPGTHFTVQVFPAFLRIYSLLRADPELVQEIPLSMNGPVKQFTVMSDLDNREIKVGGETNQGLFRYRLLQCNQKIVAVHDRGIPFFEASNLVTDSVFSREKLSLGGHRQLNWDLIARDDRRLQEVLPVWFRLGMLAPKVQIYPFEGTAKLLKECQKAIESNAPETIYPAFLNLLRVGFKGIMTPRLIDDEYQGLIHQTTIGNPEISPLTLLSEGAKLIRSLLVSCQENSIKILPQLPPEFHCGRLNNFELGGWGEVDLEWSKKIIRRLVFRAKKAGEISFHFKKARYCRLRYHNQQAEKRMESGKFLQVASNSILYMDNFEI